jgi:hypothetical protein
MAKEHRVNRMKKAAVFIGVFATLLLGAMSQKSYALTLNGTPDIKVAAIEVTRNDTSGSFSALGIAEKYNAVDMSPIPYFDLYATINNSGQLFYGGTFAVYDDVDQTGGYSTGDHLYLSGDLTALEFTPGNPVLNFLFTPTSGDYVGAYGSVGGIILGGVSNGFANGDWTIYGASADIGTPVGAPVPEPSTVVLLLMGVGGLFIARRRKV